MDIIDTLDSIKSAHAIPLPSFPVEGTVPDWIHVMPSGTFAGRDGRGPYSLADAAVVIERTLAKAAARGVPMDYDHQLENAPKNGAPAPASGWIKELAARPDGIWARVEWTDRAAAHIAAREYRYVSPVFYHDAQGRIGRIESVALTNLPNLELKALSSAHTAAFTAAKELSMDPLKELRALLGLPPDADENADDLVKAAQALASRAANPDPAKYVPVDVYAAASKELAELKSAQAALRAETLLDEARAAGKVTPAMEGWARDYAGASPDGFKSWAALAPDLRPGGESKTAASVRPPEAGSALSGEEKAICAACGISEDDFKAGV